MVSKETFQIVSCDSCGFRYTNPVPTENEAGRYYQDDAYVSHSSTQKGFVNKVYNQVRKITLNKKLKWVNSFSQGKKLIDIGCGTGHFAALMKKNGYEVIGLEPDPIARKNAKSINNIDAKDVKELSNLQSESADVITMWHVLEHVYDLKEAIQEYKRVLNNHGVLLVAVPNLESYDADYYKEYWAAYDVPRHLYHFRKEDIKRLFNGFDMELSAVLPMKFDSFYVSMLSEKYKGGSLVSAMNIGRKSNAKAKHMGYSSQVYVLKKN
jgi:SAM-dependent methyltransferase